MDGANTQMTQMEIQAFNEPFMAYEGRQSGSNVRSLLQKLATHNVTYSEDEGKQIKFNGSAFTQANLSATKAKVGAGSTYKVSFAYHEDNSGLIVDIITDPVVHVQGGAGAGAGE